MPHYSSLSEVNPGKTWVTIGAFDGVHQGHQDLINHLVSSAHAQGEKATVITFFPHPVVVLRGIQSPIYLTTQHEKAQLLLDLGVDQVITIPFTAELALLSAREFMVMLREKMDVTDLLVGYDFALGHNREGNIQKLTEIGRELSYQVHVFQPVVKDGEPVSSRQIRRLLGEGQVDVVATLLGRYYNLSGKIVHGDGRGHLIGIPTANLEYDFSRLLPRPGIYTSYSTLNQKKYLSVTNIGTNPTFINLPNPPLRVETYLLDFSGDIYGTTEVVEFVQFVRPEVRFNDVESLISRINEDILFARTHLPPIF